MRFFGFDSFFGLPPITGIDQDGPFKEGEFYASRFEVEKFFNRFGVDWEKTHLVEGWFKDTLNEKTRKKYNLRKFSLCVVDSDLYESAVQVLDFIIPHMIDKSIIWFDDWGDYGEVADNGEQKAFAEFLEKNKNIEAEPLIVPNGSGQGFIIHLK